MPALKIKRGVEEATRRKVFSAVKTEFPRNVIQYGMNTNNLIFIHLSKRAREVASRLAERYGDVALGARVALIARLTGTKFVPSPNSYAWTMEAIERTRGIKNLSYRDVVEAMLVSQPWETKSVVVYEEKGFSRDLGVTPVGEERADKLVEDLAWFNSTSIEGYLGGIKLLEKLSDGDKALLISTMRFLDDTIKVDEFRSPIALDLNTLGYLYADEGVKERPIFDGYTRVFFDDPKLEKFDKAVEERLEKVPLSPSEKEKLFRIWNAVKDSIHAFIPAYYNFLGLDPETYVPKAVAKAIIKVYLLYDVFQRYKKELSSRKRLVNAIADALGVPEPRAQEILKKLVDKLADDDIESFAKKRIPFIIHRIGKELGTAFDLPYVYLHAYGDTPYTWIAISLFIDFGIVVTPKKLRDIVGKVDADNPRLPELFADALIRRISDEREQALASVYAAFYGMGVPATRFFVPAVKSRRGILDRLYDYSMTFMTTTNIKQFIDEGILKEELYDPVTGWRVKVGDVFFEAVDRAIHYYIVGLKAFLSKDELRPDNPALYRGMLYIFSDRDFVKGYRASIDSGKSPHTKLLESLRDLLLNIGLAKHIVDEYSIEVQKLIKKGKRNHAKVVEYMEKMSRVRETIERIGSEMLSVARVYNPRYIEFLGFVSNNIYRSIMKRLEASGAGGGGEAIHRPPVVPSIAQARNYLESFAESTEELIAKAQSFEAYKNYLRKLEEKRDREKRWEKVLDTLPYFFEIVEREEQLARESRKAQERAEETRQAEEKPEEGTSKEPEQEKETEKQEEPSKEPIPSGE